MNDLKLEHLKMRKALSNGQSQYYDLNGNEEFFFLLLHFFNFQVNYILYLRFHFGNEIVVNHLCTKWK
jgi:hypothetical protein